MKATAGYQYFDSDPEEIKRDDHLIDFQQAVDLFHSFPWDDQFEAIRKISEENYSHTVPSLYFFEKEDRYLAINASDEEGFLINYIRENQIGELFIPNNVLEKPDDISVVQMIREFFDHTIEDTLELFEVEEATDRIITLELTRDKSKVYQPLWFLLLACITFFIPQADLATMLPVFMIALLLIFLFILPRLILEINYWKNDSQQTIQYDLDSQTLTIRRKDEEFVIPRSEIKSIEWVKTRASQTAFQDFTYLRFKFKDHAFAITGFTINPGEFLQMIRKNFRLIEVSYPKIDLYVMTEKKKAKRQQLHDQKKAEFLQKYAEWEDARLEEVVRKTDHYADYAVAAAREILEKRKL